LGLFGFSSIGMTSLVSTACLIFLSTVSFAMSFLIALKEFSYETLMPACLSA
jgi:hypothetical protein